MSEQPELELTPRRLTRSAEPRLVWHLATNQLNLMFLLAAGLVTGPKGFGRKYYLDPLSVAPGWIPLFAERIPARCAGAGDRGGASPPRASLPPSTWVHCAARSGRSTARGSCGSCNGPTRRAATSRCSSFRRRCRSAGCKPSCFRPRRPVRRSASRPRTMPTSRSMPTSSRSRPSLFRSGPRSVLADRGTGAARSGSVAAPGLGGRRGAGPARRARQPGECLGRGRTAVGRSRRRRRPTTPTIRYCMRCSNGRRAPALRTRARYRPEH